MEDLVSNLGFAVAIPAAIYAADNTPTGVDLLGFDSAVIEISVGVGGITFSATNKIEFVLSHSDDNAAYVPVTDADVQGVAGISGGIVRALKTAHADPDVSKVGYVGCKRYVRLLAKFGGTHGTGTAIAATVVKGDPRLAPVP